MSKTTLKPETKEMGRVTVKAKVSNLEVLWRTKRGDLTPDDVRSITFEETLVDTGCTTMGMPERFIEELGLEPVRTRWVRTANGPRKATFYQTVRVEVQDRDCTVEVFSLPDDCPVLIGQIPLEHMDFVVDPLGQRLIGNPDHDGEWVTEAY